MWKRSEGLRRNKTCEVHIAAKFSCKPCKIKSDCKTRRQKKKKVWKWKKEMVGWQQRTQNWRGAVLTGWNWVNNRGPCHRKQDRKGRSRTHLCGRSQPCETDAAKSHLSEQGLLWRGKGSTTGSRYRDSWREKGAGEQRDECKLNLKHIKQKDWGKRKQI